ncbi:2-hydroxyglutaryl-CoA dehydratase [Clostridium sp. W14A]|nr:2-hydroxyglutaryl-CoA dehydratase [Clostridium sp. W14A]
MAIAEKLAEFRKIADNPKTQLEHYKSKGMKAVGVMPYFAPEELVFAAGMFPAGMWGSNTKSISRAKEYCASFYCSLVQLDLEMLLDGTMDGLDAVITPTCCDTLRPNSQNIKVAMKNKMKVIFLAHPQNRFPECGVKYTESCYNKIRAELDEVSGHKTTDEEIQNAIKVYNRSRAARREFVKLAGAHPEAVSAVMRSGVLKASYFMLKDEYADKLEALNAELKALPASDWKGVRIVTSGIICDNPTLLKILDDNKCAIVADDVAQETRSFRCDAPEDDADPIHALAIQFRNQDYDILLYDKFSSQNRRGEYVAKMCKDNHADGLILFMQQFCDPEEMEYPYLKKALDAAGIPHIRLGIDHQMRDFGQAQTAIQAFADVLD